MKNTQPPSAQRVAVVTGSGKRLGKAIALDLARNGWAVAVHCHHSKEAAEQTAAECCSLGALCHVFVADLADEIATQALLPAVIAHFGQVDAVVNSAALFEFDNASTFKHQNLQKHMACNVAAPLILAQALFAHCVGWNAAVNSNPNSNSQAILKKGVVVNLLDQKLWNPNPDFLSYTLSKAALENANTILALALAPHIRVVGVAPGLTLTSHLLTDAEFEKLHALSPLNRSSTPQDISNAVRFALENPAITGTTLLVDGGQHLMRFPRDFSMMGTT